MHFFLFGCNIWVLIIARMLANRHPLFGKLLCNYFIAHFSNCVAQDYKVSGISFLVRAVWTARALS